MNRRKFLGFFGVAAGALPALPGIADGKPALAEKVKAYLEESAAILRECREKWPNDPIPQTTIINLRGDPFNRKQVRELVEQINRGPHGS